MKKINKKLFSMIFLFSIITTNSVYASTTIEIQKEKPKTEIELKQKQTVTNEVEKQAEETKVEEEKKNELKNSEKLGTESKASSNITNGSNLPKLPQELQPTKKTDSTIKLKSSFDENGNRVVPDEQMQFLTVETRNGVKFHIIIDYGKTDKNVKFLTEATEMDMLSVISQKEKIEAEKKAKIEAEKQEEKERKEAEETKIKLEEQQKVNNQNNQRKQIIKLVGLAFSLIFIFSMVVYLVKSKKLTKIFTKRKGMEG